MRRTLVVLALGSVIAGGCSQLRQAPAPPDAAAVTTASVGASPAVQPARKIVFDGRVELGVDDLASAGAKVVGLAESRGGFVAGSELRGPAGGDREATWILRVPTAAFRDAIDALSQLGRVAALHTTSEDVTAEFYDTTARMTAKKVEETRLLEHLKTTAKTLPDVLSLEHELERVRGEIEAMQARVDTLGHLADLATITVTLRELHPILPAVAPAFLERFAQTVTTSAIALRDMAEMIAIVFGALLPWAAVAAAVAFLARGVIHLWKRVRGRSGAGS